MASSVLDTFGPVGSTAAAGGAGGVTQPKPGSVKNTPTGTSAGQAVTPQQLLSQLIGNLANPGNLSGQVDSYIQPYIDQQLRDLNAQYAGQAAGIQSYNQSADKLIGNIANQVKGDYNTAAGQTNLIGAGIGKSLAAANPNNFTNGVTGLAGGPATGAMTGNNENAYNLGGAVLGGLGGLDADSLIQQRAAALQLARGLPALVADQGSQALAALGANAQGQTTKIMTGADTLARQYLSSLMTGDTHAAQYLEDYIKNTQSYNLGLSKIKSQDWIDLNNNNTKIAIANQTNAEKTAALRATTAYHTLEAQAAAGRLSATNFHNLISEMNYGGYALTPTPKGQTPNLTYNGQGYSVGPAKGYALTKQINPNTGLPVSVKATTPGSTSRLAAYGGMTRSEVSTNSQRVKKQVEIYFKGAEQTTGTHPSPGVPRMSYQDALANAMTDWGGQLTPAAIMNINQVVNSVYAPPSVVAKLMAAMKQAYNQGYDKTSAIQAALSAQGGDMLPPQVVQQVADQVYPGAISTVFPKGLPTNPFTGLK